MQQTTNASRSEHEDVAAVARLAKERIELAWRHDTNEPFDFRGRLGRFYDWSSDDTQFFDDF